MIINEVFIGKIEPINQMFSDFSEARAIMKKNPKATNAFKKVNKDIENFWGFAVFDLDIKYDSNKNAWTYPCSVSAFASPGDFIQCTSTGYKLDPKSRYVVTSRITTGLLLDDNITDEELFGVLLHEIGHSFTDRSAACYGMSKIGQQGMIESAILYALCYQFNLAANAIIGNRGYVKIFTATLQRCINNFAPLRALKINVDKVLDGWFGPKDNIKVKTSIKDLQCLKNRLTIQLKRAQKIKRNEQKNIARSHERLSDDFAGMYGFGPACMRALLKMHRGDYYAGNEDTIKKLAEDIAALTTEINGIIGDHPDTPDRILALLDEMEKDYATLKLSKEAKTELKKNIDELKSLIKDIKKKRGILAEYGNASLKNTYSRRINKNTENSSERDYTDRNRINKDWKNNQVGEASLIENDLFDDIEESSIDSIPYITEADMCVIEMLYLDMSLSVY